MISLDRIPKWVLNDLIKHCNVEIDKSRTSSVVSECPIGSNEWNNNVEYAQGYALARDTFQTQIDYIQQNHGK
jgi:hypothetical protein